MKRIVALLLALCMVFSLTACGSKPTFKIDENSALYQLLKERNVPELQSREEMLDILQREVYGYIPAKPEKLTFTVEEDIQADLCEGKAVCNKITANCVINGKSFSFPFYMSMPRDRKGKLPFFVHVNFTATHSNAQQPLQKIIDSGFAILYFDYEAVTNDEFDYADGLSGVLYENGERQATDAGKIAMWAWAAQRVMDYAESLKDILDMNRSVVCGHSRLGKTALLAGATDERFKFVYSNNSGCTGAALSRGKKGEKIPLIYSNNPHWFCDNYVNYVGGTDDMPFDQHYLLACVAPRKLLVGSASADSVADPISEQLSCLAAAPAFKNGFVCSDPAEIGDTFYEGDIGYHLREGKHAFTEQDWDNLITFVNKHSK